MREALVTLLGIKEQALKACIAIQLAFVMVNDTHALMEFRRQQGHTRTTGQNASLFSTSFVFTPSRVNVSVPNRCMPP